MKKQLPLVLFFVYFLASHQPVKAGDDKEKTSNLRGNGMMFTENKGQIVDMNQQLRPDILFEGCGKGAKIYLRKTGISYVFDNMAEIKDGMDVGMEDLRTKTDFSDNEMQNAKDELFQKQILNIHRIDVDFLKCNSNVKTETMYQTEGHINYYYAHCPEGIMNVNSYNEVTLRNIYNNIDVKYYGGREKGLKYDIIVNPGGDPNEIQMRYSGADDIQILHDRLYVKTSLGELEEFMPKVYQSINGQTTDVKTEYRLSSSEVNGKSWIISFKVASYNSKFPLVIDPFIWATYYGGGTTTSDNCTGITTDAVGNSIITGYTNSVNFPSSAGAFQTTLKAVGQFDIFVVKFDPNGGRSWATFYGGTSWEWGSDVTTDASNNVIVTGASQSADFPVQSAYQTTWGGNNQPDAIVIKFDQSGVRQWATFYGGFWGREWGNGVAVDVLGNVVITGFTNNQTDFPVSVGAYKTTFAGAFIVKFNSTGSRLWGTYYGGSTTCSERAHDIATDPSGNIIITGNSCSIPTTVGAFQTTFGGGVGDAFVTKFSPTGLCLWATYFGGNNRDAGSDIAVDIAGNIVVVGTTLSSDLPVSPGSFQTVYGGGGGGDIFVVKFDPNGARLWATFHGGDKYEWMASCAIDANSNIYVLGEWEDTDNGTFPMNTCGLQKTFSGGIPNPEDLFVTKFNPAGQRICSTFIGGNGEEDLEDSYDNYESSGGIAVYGNYVFLAGNNRNTFGGGNFPVTSGAFQTTTPGMYNAIIAKFCGNSCGEDNPLSVNFTNGSLCNNTALQFNSAVSSALTCDTNSYSYQWTFTGATPASSALQNPSGIVYATSGTYSVKLVINSACSKDSITKTITINNCACAMTASTAITNNITCNAGNNGSASVTISNGTSGPYTYSWSNGVTGTTSVTTIPITNLPAATYTVNVSEGSCTTTSIVTITQPTALTFTAPTITDAACGVNNGSASVSAAGGSGSLNYVWSNLATGQTITNVSAGSYIVTVTDANSCTNTTSVIINSNPSATINTVNITNVTCNGQNTGAANISASGGTGILTYSWSNNISGQTITNVPSGTYVISVTDASGCLTQSNVIITQPAVLTTPTVNTTPTGCGINTGTALANSSGGTGILAYVWSNGYTGITNTNLAANIYTVTVTDANNCSVTTTATIGTTVDPTINSVIPTNPLCSPGTGTVSAIASGGTGTLTYNWSNSSSGQTINNLTTGTYTVTVTDANNCTNISTVSITVPSVINISASQNTAASCGSNNGIALASSSGGTGTLTYNWSSGATTITASGLAAGTYIVTVIDQNSCSKTATATINNSSGPSITSVTPTNAQCFGGTGSIVATASGGTGALTYSWNTGATSPTVSNLTSGTYTVTVNDANNCPNVSTVSITAPSALIFSAPTITAASCGVNNGSATVTAMGGSGSFNYSWSNTSTGQTITSVPANTYTVTVTDANSCTSTTTILINNSPSPTINSVATTSVSCNGQNTGSAVASASGGSGTLTYSWNNGTTGTTITNISAGNYIVTVTDASGCITQSNITITEATAISVTTPSVTNATCGNTNGSLTLTTPTGGTGAYTYSWSNGATTQNVNSLSATTYSVTVTDNNGCTKTTSATVNNTTGGTVALSVASAINCNGGTGSILATATASTSPYTYSWSNGASTTTSSLQHTVGSLQSNTYTVTVTDNNGCTATSTINLTEPTAITFTSINSYTTSCGTNNGGADVTATGGTGALNYSWSTTASGQTISSVSAGTYIVTITDANSCTSTTSVLINNNPSATINSVTTTTLSCNNSNDGAAVINASGGVGTLTYSWSNATSGQTISNVNAGTYIISVTDGSGCLIQSSVVITEPTTVSAQNTNAISSTCGNNNGSANIIATGGTGNIYTYSWNTGVSSVTSGQSAIGSLQSSTYYCTVTDQNNCSYVHTFTIGNKPSPVFTGSSPIITPADCKGNSSGQIDVLISSGTGPYAYSWSSGASTITIAQNNTLNNLPAGNYSLTITDNNGCNVDTFLTLTEPTFVFTSTVTATNATCITGGSATVNISGGNTGNYTYNWSNGTSSVSNSQLVVGNNLPANNYTLTVTDSKGCTTISTTTINSPILPTVTATEQTAATCNSNNGVAVAAGSGGSGSNYTYTWSNSATGLTANNLSANNYTVTVTDGNGCTATSTIAITNSNGPNIASQNSTGTCVGQATGQATVAVAGGSGPYTYSWSNGVTSITTNLTSQISNLNSGTYTLTITDANNCTATATALLPLFPNPTANAGTDQTITNGTSIQLTASGGTSYLWTPSATLTNAGISNPIANPTQTTTYTVTVTDANSCSSTDDITVTVTTPQTCNASEADEFVANVFTPNGDGRNDILRVQGFGLTDIYFAIYNRWGQKLFETTDQTKGWDGTQNGKPIDEQTVVYYLTATCITTGANIVKKGDISVVR